ncbi:MAG: hypothetical protein E6J74_17180 [Deltaproteobacteria bacterium]|nr:MAG: hypothetical protein E6J74_17180 [Deltaproteobacteria bacterium]
MPNLLEQLTKSRRVKAKRIEPRFSRKTRRVTVTVHIDEIPIEFSILIGRLDKAIDKVCRYAHGSGPLQVLFEELIHARQKYGHIIDEKNKRRGIQSGRKEVSYDLQYAAAWTYCFLRSQWKRPKKNRNLFLQKAASRLMRRLRKEKLVTGWEDAKRSWQIRLLAAFLVGKAYAKERKQHKLTEPLERLAKFHADSFYRTYVQPKLKHVESRFRNKPKLLDSLSNAYLRKVFHPQASDASPTSP